ncbi:MAG: N-acetyl sugar amidotransferase [Candidatus Latescibacteria bacterium]|nr:N-acetyl sugar amidotransferase [Candidatus Latescibacterota bacterium]
MYQICNRCIMDTSDPEITFDSNGYCNHCTRVLKEHRNEPYCFSPEQKKKRLEMLVATIKKRGKNNRYDCIIGVSGGVDSSYTAYQVKELGLRPLAVHLDNGWDSELSVMNIENICKKLSVDLFTYVIDWEEFKDLQLSFLKASTPDSEIPSDHAIVSILYKKAQKEGLNYIIAGTNFATESILPHSWSQGHDDWKYIRSIQNKFGKMRLKSFPHRSILQRCYHKYIKRIKWINLLDYIEYDKEMAKKIIAQKLDWRDYGGKHLESNYTKIYQSYILPEKFEYDKRKAHLSSLICAGQINRKQAIDTMKEPLYAKSQLEEDILYLINKFSISRKEFDEIMRLPPKSYRDYPNYANSWYASLHKGVKGCISKLTKRTI